MADMNSSGTTSNTITIPNKGSFVVVKNSAGYIVSITATAGASSTNADGSTTISVDTAEGSIRTTTWADGSQHTVWSKSDGSSGATAFHINGSISTSISLPDGSVINTTTHADGTSSSDANDQLGNTTSVTFDAAGRKTAESWTRADGSSTEVTYFDGGNSRTINNADGTSMFVYQEDSGYKSASIINADGFVVRTAWVMPNGNRGVTNFHSDGSSDSKTTFADGSWNLQVTDAHGNSKIDFYNAEGVKWHVQWAKSDGTSGYNSFLSDGTKYTYINFGNGTSEAKSYNAEGVLQLIQKEVVHADGSKTVTRQDSFITTVYEFDSNGNWIKNSWKQANGSFGYTDYNSDGSWTGKTTNADGSWVESAGDGQGSSNETHYDINGNKIGEAWHKSDGSYESTWFNADGSVTKTSGYSDGSRSSETVFTDGSTSSETVQGDGSRQTIFNDGQGTVTTMQFDSTGTWAWTETSVTSPDGSKVVTVQDSTSTNINEYDASGFLIKNQWNHIDGRSATFLYASDGSLELTQTFADGSWLKSFTDAEGNSTQENFNASGVKTGEFWSKTDGTYGSKTFFDNGAILSHQFNADGTSISVYEDGKGYIWTANYYLDGSSSDVTVFADGMRSISSYDGKGYREGTLFNAAGEVVNQWSSTTVVNLDGSKTETHRNSDGTTSVFEYDSSGLMYKITSTGSTGAVSVTNYNADGSYYGKTTYADGSWYISSGDGRGNFEWENFDAEGVKTAEGWTKPDGSSYSKIIDSEGVRYTFSRDSDGTSMMKIESVDGSVYTEYTNSNWKITKQVWDDAQGTVTTKSYDSTGAWIWTETSVIGLDGRKVVTFTDPTSTTVNEYNAEGVLVQNYRSTADGRTATTLYGSDGSEEITRTFEDGSSSISFIDAEGNSTFENFNASGVKTSEGWSKTDGTYGYKLFFASGNVLSHQLNADGTSTSVYEDGRGYIDTTNYYLDGSSASVTVFANGTYRTSTNDGKGYSEGTLFNTEGEVINQWTSTTTVNADGSTYNKTTYADGSWYISSNDGQGNIEWENFNTEGVKTGEGRSTPDGSYYGTGVDTDIDGTVYRWFSESDGNSNTSKAEYVDGRVYTYYFTGNWELIQEVRKAADGAVTTFDFNADGSIASRTYESGDVPTTLTGADGNNTFIVHHVDDIVIAQEGAQNTVRATVDYALPDNVQTLVLEGSANLAATGNGLDNVLTGNAGDNVLNGDAGLDLLYAGAGNDTVIDLLGNNLLDGGAGDDSLTGGDGYEFVAGGAGNDTITTGNGADVIAFNRGDGQDIVNGSQAQIDTLSLGGIDYQDLEFEVSGDDLILITGVNEQITFKHWYAEGADHGIANLQMVIEGTDAYQASSSDLIHANKITQFDFNGLVTAFDQARAADSTLSSWSLESAIAAFYVGGSDTAALGGDLAYHYALNGNVSTLATDQAQVVLVGVQFGIENQALQGM
jgi:hypothetical protein